MKTTHRLTVCLEVGIEAAAGKRPAELALAVEDFLNNLSETAFAQRGTDYGKLADAATLTEPPTVTGVVVHDDVGNPLVQTGSAIRREENR